MLMQRYVARLMVLLIRGYQKIVSPFLPAACRFEPTCSSYAATSILRFGPIKGTLLSVRRVMRCHPWCPGGYDPVPPGVHRE